MSGEESDYYEPVCDALQTRFEERVDGNIHLEVTGSGTYSNRLQAQIPSGREMIFEVIGRGSSPDVAGFIERESTTDFIIVEIKPDRMSNLKPVYQCQRYVDLFRAQHGFVVAPAAISEKIRRLCQLTGVLYQDSTHSHLSIAEFDEEHGFFSNWHKEDPFEKDLYWRD